MFENQVVKLNHCMMKSKAKILKYFSIVNFVRVYKIESYDLRNIRSFGERNKLALKRKMIHSTYIKYRYEKSRFFFQE